MTGTIQAYWARVAAAALGEKTSTQGTLRHMEAGKNARYPKTKAKARENLEVGNQHRKENSPSAGMCGLGSYMDVAAAASSGMGGEVKCGGVLYLTAPRRKRGRARSVQVQGDEINHGRPQLLSRWSGQRVRRPSFAVG